jgi:hypothetical protein
MGSRSGSLACSLAIHAVLALVLSVIRFAAPFAPRPHESVYLAPPPAKTIPARAARPRLQTLPPRVFSAPASGSLRLPAPDATPAPRPPVLAPEITRVETPPPAVPMPAPVVPLRTVAHQPAITTGTFSDAVPAPRAEHAPPKVRVGSFEGDPVTAAGGRGGSRAVIAAGFDNMPAERSAAPAHAVRASGFTELALAAAPAARNTPASRGRETALEILSKPRPAYSEAARRRFLHPVRCMCCA